MFQSLKFKSGGYAGFRGNQIGKIIGSGTIGNNIEDTTSEESQSYTKDDVTNITEIGLKIPSRKENSEDLKNYFAFARCFILILYFSRVVPNF